MTRLLACCGIAAPVIYVAATLLVASLRPEYSLAVHTISRLGQIGAPYARLYNFLGELPSIILTVAFAFSILRALPKGRAVQIGVALIALAGVANVMSAGVFPRLAGPAPGAMHLGAGLVTIVCFTLAYLVLARPLRHLGSGYGLLSVAAGIAIPVLFIGVAPNVDNPGLYARLGQALGFIWMVAVAIAIIRRPGPD